MPDEDQLYLHPRDPPQYDERHPAGSDREFIMEQLARIPTRSDLARAALGIIFSTSIITTLARMVVYLSLNQSTL
jgi:hypothetical protein